MTDQDKFYFSYLDDMFQRGVDAKVSNTRPEHAEYALATMLRNAKQSVRIFPAKTEELGQLEIYNAPTVNNAARELLSKEGAKLVLILPPSLGQIGEEEMPFVNATREMESRGAMVGKMEVRLASDDAVEFLQANNFCHPMMVMDESAYRIEGAGDDDVAYVNFGNAKHASRLAGLFDDVLYDYGRELIAVGGGK